MNKRANLYHCGARPYLLKEFTVRASVRFPLRDIGHEHSRADYVRQACSCLLKGTLNIQDCLHGLSVSVFIADYLTLAVGGCGP